MAPPIIYTYVVTLRFMHVAKINAKAIIRQLMLLSRDSLFLLWGIRIGM